jgi:hypothetical protein
MFILGLSGITALLGGMISGLLPFSIAYFGWTAVIFSTIALLYFSSIPEKIIGALILSSFISFVSSASFGAFFASFVTAGVVMHIAFQRVLKQRAPLADTGAILLGVVSFFIFFAAWHELPHLFGFSAIDISYYFFFGALPGILFMLIVLFGALVIISNYSRYGSLIKL